MLSQIQASFRWIHTSHESSCNVPYFPSFAAFPEDRHVHMLSQRAQRTRSVSTVREQYFNPFVQDYVLLRSVSSLPRACNWTFPHAFFNQRDICYEPVTHVALKPRLIERAHQ